MATDAARTPQHFIRLEDLTREQLDDLLDLAARLKARPTNDALLAKSVGMLFFRGSLRTRVSLEAAMNQLGGRTIELTAASDAWELETREGTVMDGRAPEHVRDAAAVLSTYVDALAVRPAPEGQSWDIDRRDAQISAWAKHARVPVINMDSAQWHPLQALADVMTLRETFKRPAGRKLALVWVHSPRPASVSVAHSLLLAALREGLDVSVAHPAGFDLDEGVLDEARSVANERGTSLEMTGDMESAVRGAHVVYARSWESLADYGNPTLGANRRGRHAEWTVDERRMALGDDARLMHAMPIRRNVEVTDEVLDGPRSLVYEQAANRLHAQKALLSRLLR
ncbi:N-acetylornithine carbamoyltransferase [Engelhardtia mirabilis]|uniref:N-acetylornithine carbamoyltransferase n=1 Tax=Engelhardtia mirabilis TaxID=2528011 RepID=A0A518BPA8_9BACT|nr:N-acetylornithine carbamoyltransferase [Planctomycetes bacterium Pla133]QDV03139.1 N-acetylornithine carbamoyltransferase [Planctomycetes bacterium Pla86]